MNSKAELQFFLWPFLILLLSAAEGSGWSASGQRAESQLQEVVNIDFRTDLRLFTVMAALEAAGFDPESPRRSDSEVRRLLREKLAGLDPELIRRMRVYFTMRRFGDAQALHAAYTSLALLLTGPPEFEIREDTFGIPADVREILGFEELLAEFYREAEIASLWRQLEPRYAAELEAYSPVVGRVIRETLDYFRIPARVVLDRNIILMTDLLGFQDVVNARNLERSYYIVVGPTSDPEKNFVQLQHEYLHFLIDPLAEKHGGSLMKQRELLELAHEQPNLGDDFRGRFILIAAESLIEAVLQRLHPPEELDAELVDLFRRGYIFVPFFYRTLERFEELEETSFPAYLEEVFGNIDPSEIREDADQMAKLEASLAREESRREEVRAVQVENRQAARRRAEELSRAEQLMARGEFAAVRPILETLSDVDPGDGTVLFYLGQVSAQLGDHDAAFEYYDRVEEAAGIEPWVRAWSRVRRGRILASRGDWSNARRLFESVLEMQGELRGADQESRELLSRLPAAGEP